MDGLRDITITTRFESALALADVLDTELEQAAGISQRWYDVLVHLEESPAGIRMNELAERILYSKSGLTRVVDRMEEEGLVRRVRPEHDRRSILVVLTDEGAETMQEARRYHRDGIERHFSQHVTDADWHASVVRRLADECAPLSEIRAYLTATTDLSWVRKHRVAEDLFAYLVVERERLPEDWLDRFGVRWAVLRPDRFVFAAGAGRAEAQGALDALHRAVGATPGSLPAQPAARAPEAIAA